MTPPNPREALHREAIKLIRRQPESIDRDALEHTVNLLAAQPPAVSLDETGSTGAWQPIETAPKDGETRLLFWDCDWQEAFIGFRPIDCPDNACCDATHIACWPHYWRPLPAPPAALNPTQDAAHGGRHG